MGLNFQKAEIKPTDSLSLTQTTCPFVQEITPLYTINELVLSKSTEDEIKTVISAQRNWKMIFEDWGLQTTLKEKKNLFVNFYGMPGTGKTMAAHAVAEALHKKLFLVNYAEIESKYVGDTSKNLISLFNATDCIENIIFFDEADALLSKRVSNITSSNDVSVNQTRSVLLSLLNNYSGMVIFATNFLENYDPAFMRRIQFHIRFDLPDAEQRLQLWTKMIPPQMPTTVNVNHLVELSEGLSGSDISTAILKAALHAANKGLHSVDESFFTSAITVIKDSRTVTASACSNDTVTTEYVPQSAVPQSIINRSHVS